MNDVKVELADIPAVVPNEFTQHRGEWFHRPGHPAIQLEVKTGGTHGVGNPVLSVRNQIRGIALQRHASATAAPHYGGRDRVTEQPVR